MNHVLKDCKSGGTSGSKRAFRFKSINSTTEQMQFREFLKAIKFDKKNKLHLLKLHSFDDLSIQRKDILITFV